MADIPRESLNRCWCTLPDTWRLTLLNPRGAFQRGFQASKDAICCEINDSHSIKVASSDNSIDGIKNAHQDGKKLTGAH